jgi:hypothetical protein
LEEAKWQNLQAVGVEVVAEQQQGVDRRAPVFRHQSPGDGALSFTEGAPRQDVTGVTHGEEGQHALLGKRGRALGGRSVDRGRVQSGPDECRSAGYGRGDPDHDRRNPASRGHAGDSNAPGARAAPGREAAARVALRAAGRPLAGAEQSPAG